MGFSEDYRILREELGDGVAITRQMLSDYMSGTPIDELIYDDDDGGGFYARTNHIDYRRRK